jgi:cysteine-rich repeat protein
MYRIVLFRQTQAAAVVAAVALALGATGARAQDPTKCRQQIAKNAQKYTSKVTKASQKCEEGRLKGKIMGTCPDAKATDKINKAASKLSDKIGKACAGVSLVDMGFAGLVNRCVGGDGDGNRCVDDEDCRFAPPGIGPEDGVCTPTDECPTFLNGRLPNDDACEIALTDAASVASCVQCAVDVKVDTIIDTLYGSLNAASDDKDTFKCQTDIGKRTAKFFDKVEKALAKCEDGVLKDGMGTCPDAKATDKIGKALGKLNEKITDRCSSEAIISNAANPGKIYGTAQRYGGCGVTGTETSAGLASNLACLAQNAAACDVAFGIGDTACSTALCGNGQIDPGEDCDDGNTLADTGLGDADICPPDCTIAACVVDGTANVTVNITSPEDLINAVVLLTYDDAKVRVPGTGTQPPVLAAVTSGVYATSPRDLDYALRTALNDPSALGVPSGPAFTVAFDTCGAVPTTADFGCMVVDAANSGFATITGVTCSVSL